jgi:hypothetical protein
MGVYESKGNEMGRLGKKIWLYDGRMIGFGEFSVRGLRFGRFAIVSRLRLRVNI